MPAIKTCDAFEEGDIAAIVAIISLSTILSNGTGTVILFFNTPHDAIDITNIV